MHMLVIFLVLLSLIFMVMWTLSQSKEKLQQAWSGLAAPFASKNQDWATPIKAWAETSLTKDKALQAWLLALPSEGLQALGEKIAEFCVEMNVELNWLINPATEIDPAVKQAAEETVIDYCKICLKAVQNQQPAK
ncbi:hypothetical protein [Crenothrix polyspora]|uniref:Uncharacterized protein n=1 Tax=Crenothrix polyspora TaxID=360316 RepID=A0A1R4HIP3_9GAMM|nr:hypothetical protein [Crenothrix polyspora]SJM96097.1 hypothetical protein CRENPOLYSF1_850010 [Crenothrix polyspora]